MVSFAVDLVVVVGAFRLLLLLLISLFIYIQIFCSLFFFFVPRIFLRCVLLLFYSRAIFGVKNAFNPFPTCPLSFSHPFPAIELDSI